MSEISHININNETNSNKLQ